MPITYQNSLVFARQLDAQDPLSSFRERFHLPVKANGEPYIYFTGNSLGCQPKDTADFVMAELEDWQRLGVEGHFHARNPWMPYHEFLTESMARIVGGQADEVIVMNSLTVNLHLMMVSFYRPTSQRHKILIEADAFPSDIYAVNSQLRFHGYDPSEALIMVKARKGTHVVENDDILQIIETQGEEIALILLGGVNYYTGQVFEMEAITKAGHSKGCMVGFDLAHAAGNIPLALHDWEVDFACWCSYKYLNSGPGGVGGGFIHQRHIDNKKIPRFEGWWGQNKETRFLMGPDFDPIPTAEGWQLSNAPVLAMAALRASLKIFDDAGMDRLVEKSRKMTAYFLFLIREIQEELSLEIITPENPEQRGCQHSLIFKEKGKIVFQKLTDSGVICDWREPDVIRLAPVPLYNTFEEIWCFVQILASLA